MHMKTNTSCDYYFSSSFFLLFVLFFSFNNVLSLVFIWVCIFSFLALLTAQWYQQVSRLGQFGWYNCYYQHSTFRRIPGSHTNLSSLMLEWKQALKWAHSLSIFSNATTEQVVFHVYFVCTGWKYCFRPPHTLPLKWGTHFQNRNSYSTLVKSITRQMFKVLQPFWCIYFIHIDIELRLIHIMLCQCFFLMSLCNKGKAGVILKCLSEESSASPLLHSIKLTTPQCAFWPAVNPLHISVLSFILL